MDVVVLAAKSVLAVTLLIAGGAKLANLSSFAATLRLFLPPTAGSSFARLAAMAIIAAELFLGVLSLSLPSVAWINRIVFVACAAFVLVSVLGYARFRGRACQCFGALSQRKFDIPGVLRSAVLLAMSVVALAQPKPASIRLAASSRLLLLAAAILLGWSAYIAARALEAGARNLRRS